MTRCFVAVDIDDATREKAANLQKQLAGLNVKLVEKENLHITLKFLGAAAQGDIDFAKEKLAAVAKSFRPFSARIACCRAFPSLTYMRVVLLDVEGEEIKKLKASVENALSGRFGKDSASLHFTLCRVRDARQKKEIADFVAKNAAASLGTVHVAEIKLKSSVVTRNGPVYEDIAVFRLG